MELPNYQNCHIIQSQSEKERKKKERRRRKKNLTCVEKRKMGTEPILAIDFQGRPSSLARDRFTGSESGKCRPVAGRPGSAVARRVHMRIRGCSTSASAADWLFASLFTWVMGSKTERKSAQWNGQFVWIMATFVLVAGQLIRPYTCQPRWLFLRSISGESISNRFRIHSELFQFQSCPSAARTGEQTHTPTPDNHS